MCEFDLRIIWRIRVIRDISVLLVWRLLLLWLRVRRRGFARLRIPCMSVGLCARQ